jgi:hypothetical protein
MMKRWSKLQKAIYNLMDRSDNFQIHCRAYRMPKSRSSDPQIPRYWITTGKGISKKIVWDYPGPGADPYIFHEACWFKAGKPMEWRESESSDDQGFFFDEPDHNMRCPA